MATVEPAPRPSGTEREEEELTKKGELHETQMEEKFHSRFLERMWHFRLLSYAYDTANGTYQAVKNSNAVLKYAMETAENNVHRFATPITYGVMNRVYSMGEPLIEELDEFACRQLDRFEGGYFRPYETVTVLPYVALDKSLNVAEGTMDYFLPARKEAQVKDRKYEERAKAEWEKAKALGEKGGHDYEKTKSNFRYLRFRGEALACSLYERLRERLAYIPLVLPILDRATIQFNFLRNTATRALELAAETRAYAYRQFKALLGQSWRLARASLDPFYRLFRYVVTASYARAQANLAYIWSLVERLLFISHRREQRAASIRKARWPGSSRAAATTTTTTSTTGTQAAPKKTERSGQRKPTAAGTSGTKTTTTEHREEGTEHTSSKQSHSPTGTAEHHPESEEYKEGAVREKQKQFEGLAHGK